MDTRLRVARGIAKTETEASQQVFETLKQRGHPDAPPPLVSDGWGGIDEAIIEVYGVAPAYTGVGRPPTRKRPRPGWQYLQVVKQRENGRVVGTTLRVVWGNKAEVLALLGKSTAYIERTHLTMRLFNGRLTRKTLAFSKLVAMYCRLGGPGLQPGPTAQDAASGEQQRLSALATTLTCDGSWTQFGLFAWERCATCQHSTGRLSGKKTLQKSLTWQNSFGLNRCLCRGNTAFD